MICKGRDTITYYFVGLSLPVWSPSEVAHQSWLHMFHCAFTCLRRFWEYRRSSYLHTWPQNRTWGARWLLLFPRCIVIMENPCWWPVSSKIEGFLSTENRVDILNDKSQVNLIKLNYCLCWTKMGFALSRWFLLSMPAILVTYKALYTIFGLFESGNSRSGWKWITELLKMQ